MTSPRSTIARTSAQIFYWSLLIAPVTAFLKIASSNFQHYHDNNNNYQGQRRHVVLSSQSTTGTVNDANETNENNKTPQQQQDQLLATKPACWNSDVRYSHVDIIVDDLRAFLQKWCPRLGFHASAIQTWGGPNEPTWSEFAFVFDAHGALIFMVVQGKHGIHVDLLQHYGSGTIYRLCFKTNDVQGAFDHLQACGTKLTNLQGDEFHTFQDVLESGKRILWLEQEGQLSMEILTAPIIDAACEQFRQDIGLTFVHQKNDKKLSASWKKWAIPSLVALGSAFFAGYVCGKVSTRR